MSSDSEESETDKLESNKSLKQKFEEEYRRPGSLKERRLWLSQNRNTSCTHCTRKKLKCEPNPDYVRCETCKSHKSPGGCSRVAEERKSRIMKKLGIDQDMFEELLQATYGGGGDSTRVVVAKKTKDKGNAASASKSQSQPQKVKRCVPVVEIETVKRTGERNTNNVASAERTVQVTRKKKKDDSAARTKDSGTKAVEEDDSEDSDVVPAPPPKRPMLQVTLQDDESDEHDQGRRNDESDHGRPSDSRVEVAPPPPSSLTDSPFIRLHFVKRSLEVGMQTLSSQHPLRQTLKDSIDEIGDIATLELDRLRLVGMTRRGLGGGGKTGDLAQRRARESEEDDQSQRRTTKRRRIIRPPPAESSGKKCMPKHR